MNKLTVTILPVALAALTACSTPESTPPPAPITSPTVLPTTVTAPAQPGTPAVQKKARPAVKKSKPADPRQETIQKTQTIISTETIVS